MFELVFGTSCSSPVVGLLITLVNDARIAAGKSPVGKLLILFYLLYPGCLVEEMPSFINPAVELLEHDPYHLKNE